MTISGRELTERQEDYLQTLLDRMPDNEANTALTLALFDARHGCADDREWCLLAKHLKAGGW